MPFCPDCKSEYVEGTEECARCSEYLVEDLPLPAEREEFIEFYLVTDSLEADFITHILADDSIQTKSRALIDRAFPTHTNIQDGFRIAVPSHKLEDARRIIKQAIEDGAISDSGVFI